MLMSNNNYLVVDLETTIKNKIGTHKASPHSVKNHIVAAGVKWETFSTPQISFYYPTAPCKFFEKDVKTSPPMYVGHHIKFDVLYLLRLSEWKKYVWPTLVLWDTSLVEYILTGQESLFPSLDECAIKYGGTLKDSKIKELWEVGVQTEDIDKDLLGEYLKGDVINTEIVFKKQFEEAYNAGMLPLIWSQMEALKATIEMEHNGMYVDVLELSKLEDYTLIERDTAMVNVMSSINSIEPALSLPEVGPLNINSAQLISKLLFGGEFKYKISATTTEVYKTGVKKGSFKTKSCEKVIMLSNRTALKTPDLLRMGLGTTNPLIFKTNEKALKKIRPYCDKYGVVLIDSILKYRSLEKELNTYIEGVKNLIFEDSCIHGNIHHTSTDTGRLSSSQPNLQNFTNPTEE